MLSLARRLVKKAALRSVHRRNEAWQVANNRGTHLPPALWGLTVNGAGHLCADGCDFRELAHQWCRLF